MKKLFICHAGAGLPAHEQDDVGIVGMAYVWEGEWFRTPESVEGRERNPVMKLRPLWGAAVEIWGDTGCFTEAEKVLDLLEE
ncbi:hypothetical protein [Pseudomonas panipatensis]|uniref:hypothetical protein n=1 Tax=Pseudomonas panipatensis TaxID=428992 RepID=UPI000B7CA63A|nr:hypothetical protein [Pseudomonas panipatensis]